MDEIKKWLEQMLPEILCIVVLIGLFVRLKFGMYPEKYFRKKNSRNNSEKNNGSSSSKKSELSG